MPSTSKITSPGIKKKHSSDDMHLEIVIKKTLQCDNICFVKMDFANQGFIDIHFFFTINDNKRKY